MWGSEEIVKSHLLLANGSINFSQKSSGNSTLSNISWLFSSVVYLWICCKMIWRHLQYGVRHVHILMQKIH